LQHRIDRFGDCKPLPDESDRHFYGKLRRWLDGDLQERDCFGSNRDSRAGLT